MEGTLLNLTTMPSVVDAEVEAEESLLICLVEVTEAVKQRCSIQGLGIDDVNLEMLKEIGVRGLSSM